MAADDDRKAHWDAVYGRRLPDEVSWHQEDPARSLQLIREAATANDARILDVGGGASRLIDGLLAAGYLHVSVLDVSTTALDHARQRLGPRQGDVVWIEADITTWRPTADVDVWHDRAVFHFLCDRVDQLRYASAMAGAVPAGGHAIVATFAEDGPTHCSGLPVQRYSEGALAEIFTSAYIPIRFEREAHETPAGAIQHFLYGLFVRTVDEATS